jgi:Mn-dependent transcriptional regulator
MGVLRLNEPLSPSLEDYLETILQLCEEHGTTKISVIAKKLNIAKPSVTQAVASLCREGLVNHTRYGPISLTDKGRAKAREVWHRHQTISRFLYEILKVSPAVAEKDACMIEHVISPETIGQMAGWLGEKSQSNSETAAHLSLDALLPGEKARIVKIEGKSSPIKRRMLEMGLVPGVAVEMERIAPLNDPIELRIGDYHLSLRREEAALLLVERLED